MNDSDDIVVQTRYSSLMLLDLSDLDSLKTIITHFPLQRKLVLLLVLLPLGLAVASRCCYKDLGHSPIRRDKNYPTFYLLVMAADGCQWMESPRGPGGWPIPESWNPAGSGGRGQDSRISGSNPRIPESGS